MPQLFPQPVSSTSGVTIVPQGLLSGGGFIPINGTGYINGPILTQTAFVSTLGDFTIAHGLGYSPTVAWPVCLTTSSAGWFANFQDPLAWDDTNFYLWGSAASMDGFIIAIK